MKRKIKILHLLPNYSKSLLIHYYVTELDKERFQGLICYIGEKKEEQEINRGDFYLNYSDERQKRYNFHIVKDLVRLLRENPIDIIHCHNHRTHLYGVIAAWLTKTPILIYNIHSLNRTHTLRHKLINWYFFKYTNRIIAVSKAVRNDIVSSNWKVNPDKIKVIYNRIDINQYNKLSLSKNEARQKIYPSCHDRLWFGTAGRLVPTKGQIYLIEAFSKIVSRHRSKVLLLLAGEGRLEEELKYYAKRLGIDDHIIFLGRRNDIPAFLKSIDIFVLPSIAEGLSLALLEAMASRLPVIATEVGGIPEIFGDGHGKLVKARDPEDLYEAMESMISLSDKKIKSLGDTSYKIALERFTKEIMIKELMDTYEEVISDIKDL